MPAVFVGHGNPMNSLEHNHFTNAWVELASSMPKPKKILAISAHWFVNITAVTAMAAPRTIHDFYGFPQALFDVQYPAPGDPGLAAQIIELVDPIHVGADMDSWGIDHGSWSVLTHMYPDADVPVVQLSVHAEKALDFHLDLGAALDPLRDEGVLIFCSGNVVHNLGMIDWGLPNKGSDWAIRFDDAARAVMTTDPGSLPSLLALPDFRAAVPTPEHFLPLAYLAGAARAEGSVARTFLEGCDMGSLSMTSYVVSD